MFFVICGLFLATTGGAPAQQQSPPAPVTTRPQTTALAPGAESPLAVAERLYRTGDLDAAAQDYKRILQADPGSGLAYAGLARVLLKQKKPVEASAAAAKAIELAPRLDGARVALGEVYFRQGKLAEAEQEFAALVNAPTKEPRAYLGMARIYKSASYYKHWKQMVDHAYNLDPADPDIRRAWIETLSGQGRVKALQDYLAGPTNDDTEERRGLQRELAVRQDQATHPGRECGVTSKVNTMELGFEKFLRDLNHISAYGLRVKLNDTASRLLLDTGAGGITVDRKIADKAGIQRIVEMESKGIGDSRGSAGYVGYADSIKVGDLEFRGCYVIVIDKGSIPGDGLIGSDVFSDFLVDIDYPNQKFRLSDSPRRPDEPISSVNAESAGSSRPILHDRYVAPEMKEYTPIFRFGHALLIQTRVNEMPPTLFLIDTGGFSNMISPAVASEVTKVSADGTATIKGLSGNVKKVFRASELTLQFANMRQKNQDMFAFDTKRLSDYIGTEQSGILGFTLLRMLEIKIDYRDGLVDFKYDPGHH